jgi:hypothetical protein
MNCAGKCCAVPSISEFFDNIRAENKELLDEKYTEIVASKETERKKIMAGRFKCDCVWAGSGNAPRQYMNRGYRGGNPFWCKKCPEVPGDAVYLNNAICCIDGCSKPASWSPDGTRDNRVCGPHRDKTRKDEYINVVTLRCPCGKCMIYNYPGETRGVACKDCKKEGMENVNSPKCPCGKRMNFNYPGETIGVACSKCKKEGMVNVTGKLCPCGKHMSYNFLGEKRPIACKDCAKEGMVNVVAKLCPCGKHMSYNYPSEAVGIACKDCKKEGMEDVVSKLCQGYNGVACPVRTYIGRSTAYCASCDPDPKRALSRKKFEDAFFKFVGGKIDLKKREFRVDYDRTETTKKFARVDGIVFRDHLIVCIEVDENGHSDDSYVCDESRMHLVTGELLQKYHGHDVAWIRVNPTIPDLANQWTKKANATRNKLFERTIVAVNEATHGIVYID